MAIEKGMFAAPEGIDVEIEGDEPVEPVEQALEIEIVDPEMVTLSDGSVEITLIPDAAPTDMLPFDVNLAEHLDDSILQSLSNDLIGLIDSDMDSRKEWADTYVKGLDVLGFKYEERTTP